MGLGFIVILANVRCVVQKKPRKAGDQAYMGNNMHTTLAIATVKPVWQVSSLSVAGSSPAAATDTCGDRPPSSLPPISSLSP